MRTASTYRAARKAAVKAMKQDWASAPENGTSRIGVYRPVQPSPSKYPPHQGNRECARRASSPPS